MTLHLDFQNDSARHLQLALRGREALLRPGDSTGFVIPLSEVLRGGHVPVAITTPVSPDGTTITSATGGEIYTVDGVWSFGPLIDGASAAVLLNGVQPNAYRWNGTSLMVAQGAAYLYSNSEWWVWSPRRFTLCADGPPGL